MKREGWFLSLILFLGVVCFFCFAEEKITITTYYPAPYGVYNQLVTNTLGVGNTNKDTKLDSKDAPDPITSNVKLEVAGGSIKATGGLIIQSVDSQTDEDVMTKGVGQIWIRSDITP